MTFVCLWSPRWSTAGAPLADLATALLEVAPRLAVDARGVVWVDGHGLPAPHLARSLLERQEGVEGVGEVRAGVAAIPVVAELAARAGDTPVTFVEPGHERAFLAPLSLELLEPDPRLWALFQGVGVRTCGEMAALDREAVEVRFGARGAPLWRLSRADDPRLLFRPIPRERPHAAMDFVDYTVRDAQRLVFTANALLGSVCATLAERGERAREMTLSLPLSGGGAVRETLRTARPTAERVVWLRRVQGALERLRLPEPAAGIALQVEAAEPSSATQGDLFDRGFATAAPVEEAVARLLDEQGPVFAAPETTLHPLPERRTVWRSRPAAEAAETGGKAPPSPAPRLTLQLLPHPRPIAVYPRLRRQELVPARFLDGGRWRTLLEVAGPDRVSGGAWEDTPYHRDYFRCVTESGALVWLFHDVRTGSWFLHGWWD